MKKILLFLIISSVLISCKNNDKQNFEENLKNAEQGNADAQYKLGNCYKSGKVTSKEVEKAIYWYKKSAEQGNTQAQYELGYWIQFHQLNFPSYNQEKLEHDYTHIRKKHSFEEFKEALFWYKKSAEQGNAQAQYYLGLCCSIMYKFDVKTSNKESLKQFEEAIYWYRKSVKQGYAQAQNELADCILFMILPYKEITLESRKEAALLYKNSAEQGNAESQYELGKCYRYSRGISKDLKKAAYWYKKSSDQGNTYAKDGAEDCLDKFYRDSIFNLPCSNIIKNKTDTVVNKKIYVLGKNLTNSISNKLAKVDNIENYYAIFNLNINGSGVLTLSSSYEERRTTFRKNKSNTFLKLNCNVFIPVISTTDTYFDKEANKEVNECRGRTHCGGNDTIHFSVNEMGDGNFIGTRSQCN